MKREIKFRAWDSNHKVIINPYCELRDGNFWGEDCTNTGIGVVHEHVMQFTGLLDKKQKEIYEGDVLSFELGFKSSDFNSNHRGVEGYSSQNGFNGVVEWNDKFHQWQVVNVKFIKAINDSDYVFRMNQQSWTKDELIFYCNIKSTGLHKANYPEVIGNIYEHPELLKYENQLNLKR